VSIEHLASSFPKGRNGKQIPVRQSSREGDHNSRVKRHLKYFPDEGARHIRNSVRKDLIKLVIFYFPGAERKAQAREERALPEEIAWPTHKSRANLIALLTSTILDAGKVVIKDPIFPFETVCI
jgi:hypothetical protein